MFLKKVHDPYFTMALTEMILFYAIYILKMLSQRKRGIRTRQLVRGAAKEGKTRIIEILLSIATGVIVPIQLISMLEDRSLLPSELRVLGIILGALGDIIFLIAVITMKDSWRAGIPTENEKTALISNGIYRYSRNPAFFGFDLMYIGFQLVYFNLFLLPFTIFAVLMLHLQILREEEYLTSTFGGEYLKYKERTSRYFGKKN